MVMNFARSNVDSRVSIYSLSIVFTLGHRVAHGCMVPCHSARTGSALWSCCFSMLVRSNQPGCGLSSARQGGGLEVGTPFRLMATCLCSLSLRWFVDQ